MWWLTVGCERPDGATRSQARPRPSRAMNDSSAADRVGEGGERVSEELGLILVECVFADRRAAGDGIERCGAASYHAKTISKIFEEIH